MKNFFTRNRMGFNILCAIFFLFTSIMKVVEHSEAKNKGMNLFGITISGIMAIFYVVEVILLYRKKKINRLLKLEIVDDGVTFTT